MDTVTDTTIDTAETKPEIQTTEATETTSAAPEQTSAPSARDVISAAFDELQNAKAAEAAKSDDAKGARKVETAAPSTASTAPAATETKVPDDIDPISGKKLESIRAPNTMPAVLREKWSSIPRDMQQYWAKRELDLQQNLSRLSDNTKFADAMRKAAEPLAPVLKQWNMTVDQAASRLFQEVQILTSGTPQQRAQYLGHLINQYRPDAATLKAVLSGQAVNVSMQVQKPVDVDALAEQKITERTQQAEQEKANKVVETFLNDPANEFAHDVRKEMLGAISSGFISDEGKTLEQVLKEAYDFAVRNRSDLQEILKGRGQSQTAAATATTQATPPANAQKPVRSAKPSLGGGKTTAVPAKKYKDIKRAAYDAWDELQGNG